MVTFVFLKDIIPFIIINDQRDNLAGIDGLLERTNVL